MNEKVEELKTKISENGGLINTLVDFMVVARDAKKTSPEDLLEVKGIIMVMLEEFVNQRMVVVFGEDFRKVGGHLKKQLDECIAIQKSPSFAYRQSLLEHLMWIIFLLGSNYDGSLGLEETCSEQYKGEVEKFANLLLHSVGD